MGGGLVPLSPTPLFVVTNTCMDIIIMNQPAQPPPNPRVRILRIVGNGFSLSFFLLVQNFDKSAGPSSHTNFQFATDAYVIYM